MACPVPRLYFWLHTVLSVCPAVYSIFAMAYHVPWYPCAWLWDMLSVCPIAWPYSFLSCCPCVQLHTSWFLYPDVYRDVCESSMKSYCLCFRLNSAQFVCCMSYCLCIQEEEHGAGPLSEAEYFDSSLDLHGRDIGRQRHIAKRVQVAAAEAVTSGCLCRLQL